MHARHVALPVEEHALFHYDHRGLDVPRDPGAALQLHARGGDHVADELAMNDQTAGLDRCVNARGGAEDQGVLRADLAAELPVEHHRSRACVLALDLGPFVQEPADATTYIRNSGSSLPH